MKNAYWGYWLVMLGIFVVVIMMLASDATTTNTQDYYQLKEVANGALYDSLDYSYYSSTKQVRIIKEIFVENFLRRFAETISQADTYRVQFYDLYESPPKVSVKIATSTAGFIVGRDAGDDAVTSLDVVNSIDLIIELDANDPDQCGSDVNCDRSLIDKSQCPYYGGGGGSHTGGGNPGGGNPGGGNPGGGNPGGGNPGGGNPGGGNPGGGNPGGGNPGGGSHTPATPTTPTPSPAAVSCTDANMVEFDVSGFRAYPMRQINFKKAPNDSTDQISLNAGTELTVAGRSKTTHNSAYYWLVKKSDGQCGWVYEPYMAVDLTQYIPEMNYDIFNASSARYKSRDQSLNNITGQRLYTSDYKPIATYSFAKKLKNAATAALNAGDRLLVNDAYRPKPVSTYIYNTASGQSAFIQGVSGGRPSWFLSAGTSKHNTGCAVDITIAGAESEMPTAMHDVSMDAMKYTTWTRSEDVSMYSQKMKDSDAAKRLHNYMRMAQLQDLPSEWWHYEDSDCHNRLKNTPGTFWSAK